MLVTIIVLLALMLIVNTLIMFMVASIVSNGRETREAYRELQTEKLKRWETQIIKGFKEP